MKRLVLIPLVFVVAACTSTNANRVRGFARDADEIRNRLHIPGMSAAILENQKVLWTRGFGYADLENKVPATPDTLYSVASVTKTFGSTLLMQLVEKGQVALDEPITKYPPSRYAPAITDERRSATSSVTRPAARRARNSRTTATSTTRSPASSRRNTARRLRTSSRDRFSIRCK